MKLEFASVKLEIQEFSELVFFHFSCMHLFNRMITAYLLLLVLPSSPRNAKATFVNQSVVEIRWRSPLVPGDSSHVFYDVECRKSCNIDDENNCVEKPCSGDVKYEPYKKGLNVTQVIVTNLMPFINYTFKVYATNRVSEIAKRKHGVGRNFTTITLRTSGSGEWTIQTTSIVRFIVIMISQILLL